MGHEHLIDHLLSEAEARREEIVRRARSEAADLLSQARDRAQAAAREAEGPQAAAIARETRARAGQARARAREVFLRAEAALAEEILGRLDDLLARVPGEPGYPALAEALLREAVIDLPDGEIVVEADPAAAAALEGAGRDPRIRFEPLPAEEGPWGIVARDAQGTVAVRNTARSRLERAMPDLLAEIRRALGDADG